MLALRCNNTSFIYFPPEDCFRNYNGKKSDMSHQVASKSSKYFHKIAHFLAFFSKVILCCFLVKGHILDTSTNHKFPF